MSEVSTGSRVPNSPKCKQLEQSISPLHFTTHDPAPLPLCIIHTLLLDQKGGELAVRYQAEIWRHHRNQLLEKHQL